MYIFRFSHLGIKKKTTPSRSDTYISTRKCNKIRLLTHLFENLQPSSIISNTLKVTVKMKVQWHKSWNVKQQLTYRKQWKPHVFPPCPRACYSKLPSIPTVTDCQSIINKLFFTAAVINAKCVHFHSRPWHEGGQIQICCEKICNFILHSYKQFHLNAQYTFN